MNSQDSPTGSVRRTFLRAGLTGAAALGAGLTLSTTSASAATRARPDTPDEALREPAASNKRWRTYREKHPDETPSVRQTLVSGQHPFALVLGCIDSRVPPELVFDQGLGDLMTVRSGGEVLDEAVLGSVAYGVLELGIPLVMVLGHQSCGAVRAAVEVDASGERLPHPRQGLWVVHVDLLPDAHGRVRVIRSIPGVGARSPGERGPEWCPAERCSRRIA